MTETATVSTKEAKPEQGASQESQRIESAEISTSMRLFPEEFTDNPAEPEVAEKPAENVETHVAKTEEEVISLDVLKGKKVKVKIDGEERIVNAEDVWKGYQTDQHLTKKGQTLGEERRKLLDERRQLEELKSSLLAKQQEVKKPVPEEVEAWKDTIDPFISPVNQRVEQLEQVLSQMREVVRPVQYENNLKQLDSTFKKDGFDDFRDYVPRIEEAIYKMPEGQQRSYDSWEGYRALYMEMKLKDMKSQTSVSARPVSSDERPIPPVAVESGSSAKSPVDVDAQYNKAFERATKSGRTEDWMEVVALKGR